jgi:PAS domain S-box-containing protein
MRHEEVHSEVAASLSTLLETTADLWAALDLDLRLRLFNRAFEQYIQNTYGVLPKAGMLPEHFLPAQATAGWPQLIARALEIGSFQSRHTLADGRSLDLSFHPILSAGKITGISVFGKDITEQVAAEAALLQTEQRYRSILDGAVEGVFQLSAAGALLYANRAFLETFGFATVEEMQAAFPALLRMAWINQAERLEFSRRLKQEGFLHGFECRLRRWDGTSFWASVSARNVMDREGRVLSMEGFVEDISPRRQMLAEMTEHEERFRATFEQAAIGIQHSSFEGRILRCNRRFAEMIGYPIEEIVGRTFMQFTWPEDLAESERRIRLLNDGIAPSVSFEKRYRRKDDSPTWVRLTVSTQHDGHGIPLHYITFVEDINEQKAAKLRLTAATEALWASEVRYRTAFHTSLDAIAITRLEDGSIVDVNQTYLDTYGYRRDELIGHSVLDCNIWVNPADRHSMVDEVNRSGFCHDVEFRFRRKNGEIFWARFSNTRIELDGIPSLLCVLRDISDRKAAEERMTAAADALRASETRYRTAFQTSNDSMAISRLETGEVVDVNQAFLHIHGYQSREEVVGRSGLELQLWANPQDRSKLIAALRRDSTCRDMEFQFRRKNGELFWALISASRIELDGVANSLIVARDISARKAAEEQMAATAEALRASEIRYRTAFQTSYDGISLSRLQDGRIIDVNEMYLRTFGLQREQVLGRTSQEIGIWTDPEDRPRIVEMLGDATAFRDHEVQFQRANGERFWAMVSASRCEVDAEQCMLSVIHDISKRKADQERVAAAMEALRASEQVYHTVFDTCLDALALSEVETGSTSKSTRDFSTSPAGSGKKSSAAPPSTSTYGPIRRIVRASLRSCAITANATALNAACAEKARMFSGACSPPPPWC